jgi:lysophospholipase L1-like esterase
MKIQEYLYTDQTPTTKTKKLAYNANGATEFRRQLNEFVAPNTNTKVQVKPGDTLYTMTRQYLGEDAKKISNHEILNIAINIANKNGISQPNKIFPGQVIDFSSISTTEDTNSSVVVKNTTLRSSENVSSSLGTAAIGDQTVQTNKGSIKITMIGDSIGVGIGDHLLAQNGIKPNYSSDRKSIVQNEKNISVNSKVGDRTDQILAKIKGHSDYQNSNVAIISAGTNDMVGQASSSVAAMDKVRTNLDNIRSELKSDSYIWILPYDPKASGLVSEIANKYGDKTIALSDYEKADAYHPKSYKKITERINLLNQPKATSEIPSTASVLASKKLDLGLLSANAN